MTNSEGDMTMVERPTKAMKRTLEYVRDNEPIGQFPFGLLMIHKGEALGLIERAGREGGAFGFVRYRLTDAGRTALSTPEGE